MTQNAFTTLTSRMLPLPIDNVDTDQIIPARFLKRTERKGLGVDLFHDWRWDSEGRPRPEFPLNHYQYQGAQVLICGDNFGCGSSREHAPWALRDFGFRALISPRFADIFKSNAMKNGLLPIELSQELVDRLVERATTDPLAEIVIDLASQSASADGVRMSFGIDGFAKLCLLNGTDQLGFLLGQSRWIDAFERTYPAAFDTRQAEGSR